MYKSTPITKKAGSPLYLNETLVEGSKQTNKKFSSGDPFPTTIKEEGAEGTPGTTTTVESEKPQVGGYRRACGSKNDGSTGTDPETGSTFVCKQAEAGKEPEEMEKVEVTTPGTEGTPDTYDSVQTKRQDFGTNVGDIEQREMNRVTKKAEKDVRRGKIKTARSEARGYTVNDEGVAEKTGKKLKGKEKRNFLKDARQKAKAEERAAETKSFKNRASNAAEGQASGKGLDQSYRRADVDESQADFSRPEQVQMIKASNEAKRSAETDTQRYAREAANLNKFQLTAADTSAGDSFIKKYGSPFGMNKSPMKKNYFKK
jgi:hypothetical protein